jgi:hypothetical protein
VACGNTQNQVQDDLARGYLRPKASGIATPPRPAAWSAPHKTRARASCARNAGTEPLRQHHRPVLPALTFTDNYCATLEVHILYAELQALANSHSRAIEQLGKQKVFAGEQREELRHLIATKHDG